MKKMFFELTTSSKKKKEKPEKKIELEGIEKEVKIESKRDRSRSGSVGGGKGGKSSSSGGHTGSKSQVKVKELLKDADQKYIEPFLEIPGTNSKKKKKCKDSRGNGDGDYVVCSFLDTVMDNNDEDRDLSWLEQGDCNSCNHTKNAGLREYFEKRSIVANVKGGDSRLLRKLFWFREKESHDVKQRFLSPTLLTFRKALHFSSMFAYLSKKLEMPYSVLSVAWSNEDGYLACGCNGLVKVLKIDVMEQNLSGLQNGGYLAAPTNISKNQTLEGHKSNVLAIAWNNKLKKLTTSDTRGLTTVWKMCRGSWCEEMVHNRDNTAVCDLSWSQCGKKICIVYEDGNVIVGSADGARIWGCELKLKGSKVAGLAWAPNGSQVLFALTNGELLSYDQHGAFQSRMKLNRWGHGNSSIVKKSHSTSKNYIGFNHNKDKDSHGHDHGDENDDSSDVICIRWHAGGIEFFWTLPTLAIVRKNNCMHLLRNSHDEDAIMAETQILATCGDWSPNGQFFAVGGAPKICTSSPNDNSHFKPLPFDQINVFSPFGVFLQSIKIPGSPCSSLAWDNLSLRLAAGVGENIFFANVRPCYKFTLYGPTHNQTLVYAFNLADGSAQLGFWTENEQKLLIQEIPGKIVDIKGNENYCAILSLTTTGCYNATILNANGNPIDSITIVTIDPFMINLTGSVLICVAPNAVNVWRFDDSSKDDVIGTDLVARRRLRIFHIDESPTIIGESTDESKLKEPTSDPASCSDAVGQMLIVCRDSGKLQVYSLPHGALMNTIDTFFVMNFRPQRIWLNMDGSQVAMIDKQGHLSVCSLGSASIKTALARKLDRKDVWNILWAADNPNLICVMEKTKLYVIRNGEAEEPVLTSAYLASFKDLKITSVLMDELLLNPDKPQKDLIIRLESRALRETRRLLEKHAPPQEIFSYIEKNEHCVLWKLLAGEALSVLDLEMAETAFLRSQDYSGIIMVKKLMAIESEALRRAEIACYFGDFETAESCYIQAGRKEMASKMWKQLNDWKKVDSSLLLSRQRPSDSAVGEMSIIKGDAFFEIQEWSKALTFYETAGETSKMIKCYTLLEDYEKIDKLVHNNLREGDPLLLQIAAIFKSRGLCKEAVNAYLKYDYEHPSKAIETAIALSQWSLALQIAQNYSMDIVEPLLLRYVVHLLKKDGGVMPAIDLMIKSNKPYGAGKLLVVTALGELEEKEVDLARLKKLFVFAALLFVYKGIRFVKKRGSGKDQFHNMAKPFNEEESDDLFFENYLQEKYRPSVFVYKWMRETPWRGAEAVHYLILTQTLIYQGSYESATRTALYLRNYVDILGSERVNSLIALAAANSGNFGVCSKAFMVLETVDEEYEEVVSELFSKNMPRDSQIQTFQCNKCRSSIPNVLSSCPDCNTNFELCVMTGHPLHKDASNIWTCQVCNHSSEKNAVKSRHSCPFCHSERSSSLENIL